MGNFLCSVVLLLLCRLSFSQADDSLNFLVVGDWGGKPSYPYYTPAEKEIADVMGKKASEIGSQFTWALGDNFYDTGVKDVYDKRFQETYEKVFTASSLQSRWYVICGNHDHYGNCSAEIAYTKRSNRWYFPDYYYSEEFSIPNSDKKVGVLFIDTVLLAGLTHPVERSRPPSGPSSLQVADDQWKWIEKTLMEYAKPDSDIQWKIVAGHYPVWSVAEHGPTKELVENLLPMLEKYNVTAYICGHEHNMQHINSSNVQYYVTGAGHLIDDSMSHQDDIPKGTLQFHYGPRGNSDSKGGFTSLSITSSKMVVTFYDYTGATLYASTNYIQGLN